MVKSAIEDLLAAALAVGLREHHELDVGGIASERAERIHKVVDLIIGQGQAPGGVGLLQRSAATPRMSTCCMGAGCSSVNRPAASVRLASAVSVMRWLLQELGHLAELVRARA
jgi:hypothetical protein